MDLIAVNHKLWLKLLTQFNAWQTDVVGLGLRKKDYSFFLRFKKKKPNNNKKKQKQRVSVEKVHSTIVYKSTGVWYSDNCTWNIIF